MASRNEEVAWAAGLFEDEGCMTICSGRRTLQLASTDEDSPRRFYEILGVGKAYGPDDQGPPRKPHWVWVTYGLALLAIQLLEPWLGERRRNRARRPFGEEYVPKHT